METTKAQSEVWFRRVVVVWLVVADAESSSEQPAALCTKIVRWRSNTARHLRTDALPEYARTYVRYQTIIIEREHDVPLGIHRNRRLVLWLCVRQIIL